MFSADQVLTEIEQIVDCSVGTQESPSLSNRLELPHPSFPDPGRLMRLLCPIIFILFSTEDRLENQLTMGNTITPQLICHDLPGFTLVTPQQTLEEALRSSPIPFGLKIDIYHFTILVNCSPQVILFTVYLYEDFIDEEGITVALMLSLQSSSV